MKHLKEFNRFFEDVSVYADGGNAAIAKGNLFPEEEEMEEKAIPMDDLVAPEAHLGLLLREETSLGILEKTLVLWNFQEKQIMGAADIEWDKDMKHWVVWKTAAEKNFGPDMYDFALMTGYPNGVMPSHTIRPAARNVWTYYMDHRPDVTKEIVRPGDHKYRKDYIRDQDHEDQPENDPEFLRVINAIYYLKPTRYYHELLADGEKYCLQYGIKASAIMTDKRFNSYFNSKYRPMEDEIVK